MQRSYSQAKIAELVACPEHCFDEPASERWLYLCSSLSKYQPPSGDFVIKKEQKWELASAFQKAIRRADKTTALKLISWIANMPDEYAYFVRRTCVIACEDVGPADDTLVRFTISCAARMFFMLSWPRPFLITLNVPVLIVPASAAVTSPEIVRTLAA